MNAQLAFVKLSLLNTFVRLGLAFLGLIFERGTMFFFERGIHWRDRVYLCVCACVCVNMLGTLRAFHWPKMYYRCIEWFVSLSFVLGQTVSFMDAKKD